MEHDLAAVCHLAPSSGLRSNSTCNRITYAQAGCNGRIVIYRHKNQADLPVPKDQAAPGKPELCRVIHGPVDKQKPGDIESHNQFPACMTPYSTKHSEEKQRNPH